MSIWITSPWWGGRGTGPDEILDLSKVLTSPRSRTGSRPIVERWKFGLKHVCRWGVRRSTFWKPRPFRSVSTVRVIAFGSADLGVSTGRMRGGKEGIDAAEGGSESGGITIGGGVGVGDGTVDGEDCDVWMGGGVTGRGWCVLEQVVGC